MYYQKQQSLGFWPFTTDNHFDREFPNSLVPIPYSLTTAERDLALAHNAEVNRKLQEQKVKEGIASGQYVQSTSNTPSADWWFGSPQGSSDVTRLRPILDYWGATTPQEPQGLRKVDTNTPTRAVQPGILDTLLAPFTNMFPSGPLPVAVSHTPSTPTVLPRLDPTTTPPKDSNKKNKDNTLTYAIIGLAVVGAGFYYFNSTTKTKSVTPANTLI